MARGRRDSAAGFSPADGDAATRLDRWLVHARLFKTRSLAVARIEGGGVRLNGQPCRKPGHILRPGDVLTVPVPGRVRSLRVVAAGLRRGPPAEARTLYDDLDATDCGSASGLGARAAKTEGSDTGAP